MPLSHDKINPSEEHEMQILLKRAKQLAQKTVRDERKAGDYLEVLKFSIANDIYAIDTNVIKETLLNNGITFIPCTPAFVAGVHTIRGELTSVLETSLLLGYQTKSAADSKIIIVNDGKQKVGLLVDDVIGVSSVLLSELQPTLATVPEARARYIRGIADGLVLLIDIESLLNDPLIIVDEQVPG